MERQWVITQACKGWITDGDMEYQLGALALQARGTECRSQTEEERHELFLDKRRIVQTLVDRVHIGSA